MMCGMGSVWKLSSGSSGRAAWCMPAHAGPRVSGGGVQAGGTDHDGTARWVQQDVPPPRQQRAPLLAVAHRKHPRVEGSPPRVARDVTAPGLQVLRLPLHLHLRRQSSGGGGETGLARLAATIGHAGCAPGHTRPERLWAGGSIGIPPQKQPVEALARLSGPFCSPCATGSQWRCRSRQRGATPGRHWDHPARSCLQGPAVKEARWGPHTPGNPQAGCGTRLCCMCCLHGGADALAAGQGWEARGHPPESLTTTVSTLSSSSIVSTSWTCASSAGWWAPAQRSLGT